MLFLSTSSGRFLLADVTSAVVRQKVVSWFGKSAFISSCADCFSSQQQALLPFNDKILGCHIQRLFHLFYLTVFSLLLGNWPIDVSERKHRYLLKGLCMQQKCSRRACWVEALMGPQINIRNPCTTHHRLSVIDISCYIKDH